MLRRKIEDLQMACDGRFTAGHGQMCRLHLDAYDHLTGKIAELDALVAEAAAPFEAIIARRLPSPGSGSAPPRSSSPRPAGTWPGSLLRPGWRPGPGWRPATTNQPDKRKKAPARKGNPHLRTAMVEAAWATWRTATRPGARFRRLARRFGKGNEKKAAIAVAHTLLCIAWAVMRYDADYIDADADYYERRDQRNREHLVRYHQNALARLGLHVTVTASGDGAPPSPTPDNPGQAA